MAIGPASTSRQRGKKNNIVEFGGKHPQGSTAILYISRKCGGRELRSVETIYKDIKIKAAMKLYYYPDPSMDAVRLFEVSERRAALSYQGCEKVCGGVGTSPQTRVHGTNVRQRRR